MGYDRAGDGKAIVAVGNSDAARHTAVWVPGMGSDLDGVQGDTVRVKNLQEAADKLTPDVRGDVAAIMRLGYDAPEDIPGGAPSVVGHGRAEHGGEALDRFIIGMHATHTSGENHLTVAGHSYGSTVVAEAAQSRGGMAVSDIVVAGSRGMHADHAADLNIDPRHVWAGSAPGDYVSDGANHPFSIGAREVPGSGGGAAAGLTWLWEQGHGESPHRPEFGANRFHVDTTGHGGYWKEGSVSLLNQAFIVVGRYDDVILDRGSYPS